MHATNILLHVVCGTIALIIGFFAIWFNRRSVIHRRLGYVFLCLLAIVVATGFIGWLFFRSNPFLLMLTLLSGYVGYSGWRVMRLRERRGTWWDAGVAVVVLSCGLVYLHALLQHDDAWSPTVLYSTLGALVLVTGYDLVKYFFLHPVIKTWWLYEHIYKMISAFSALLSAFGGTVLPNSFKPYSQVGPSGLGITLIIVFIVIEARRKHRKTSIAQAG